jgi:hypothetical protein
MPTERPPLVGEVSATLRIVRCRVVSVVDPLRPEPLLFLPKLLILTLKSNIAEDSTP